MSTKTEIIDFGERVVCDFCNDDYTGNQTSGGVLFGSYAVCPKCTPKLLDDCATYGETDRITARCPADQSFWKWTLSLRNGDNTIKIITKI